MQADIQALREKKLFQLIFCKENKAKAEVVNNFRRQYVSCFFLKKMCSGVHFSPLVSFMICNLNYIAYIECRFLLDQQMSASKST